MDQLLFPLPLAGTKRESGRRSFDGSAGLAAARKDGQSLHQPPKPPLASRRGQGLAYPEVRTMPRPRNASPSFSLFHRARRILSFSSGRKRENGAPAAPRAVGRGGAKERNEAVAVRRLRSEADFAPTKWGGALHQPSLVSNLPRPSGRAPSQGLTQTHSSPSRDRAIRPSTSSLASAARTSSTLGRVAGCRGVKTVQQSS